MIDSKHLQDQQDTADALNNYFSSISDKITKIMYKRGRT